MKSETAKRARRSQGKQDAPPPAGFDAVFGFLGLALATPLTAAATVPIRHWFGIEKGGLLTEEVGSK